MTILKSIFALFMLVFCIYSFRRKRKQKKLRNASEILEKRDVAFLESIDEIMGAQDCLKFENMFLKENERRRSTIINHLSKQRDILSTLKQYALAKPESSIINGITGNVLVNLAWGARSGLTADKVSREQFDSFYKLLDLAEMHLREAIELNPYDALAHMSLIRYCVGTQKRGEALQCFESAQALLPNHLGICIITALTRTPKWGGSRRELIAFCKDCVSSDAKGPINAMIPLAHYEIRMDALLSRDLKSYLGYYEEQGVREEIDQAFSRLDASNFKNDDDIYRALNIFAKCYIDMRNKEVAKEIFSLIEDNYTDYPWHYENGNALESFIDAKYSLGILL